MKNITFLAGNIEQARSLAERMGVSKQEFHYVNSSYKLRGLRGGILIRCGTWLERSDWEEYYRIAVHNKMVILDER